MVLTGLRSHDQAAGMRRCRTGSPLRHTTRPAPEEARILGMGRHGSRVERVHQRTECTEQHARLDRGDCRQGAGADVSVNDDRLARVLAGPLDQFCVATQPEDATLSGFERSVRAWCRGSEYVHLTDEQYSKLRIVD